MDRCAIFVDAGYLYAEGGRLCRQTTSRSALLLKPEPFLSLMTSVAEELTGMPVLRTYWYDAARGGHRTSEQRAIAVLPDVKLRLGRLNGSGQQKGVDALIYRDMIMLAQLGAVSDVLLVSGDEDLREGVRTAQDHGVRVVLVGIEAESGKYNQSEELVFESDRLHSLSKDELTPVFDLRPPLPPPTVLPIPVQIESGEDADGEQATPSPIQAMLTPRAASAEFTARWLANSSSSELADLLARRPSIPHALDQGLRAHVEQALGIDLQEQEQIRRDVRSAFWGVVAANVDSRQL
ncbi:NYN domain-containing protein [Actinoalloteichus fjordicus]|uniref:NYN domain n=1 Tax=Actinoalloteichus fjordicus TaxID=1612552 RepID=A0AAC9LEG7_9PSEU|nr:NYN domain-containing protein [Actinoalloteichus fjordicus]APU16152.1 NYN domain [Actinoalloteichus fjordicus]